MATKVTLQLSDDEEFREQVRNMIKGAVQGVVREQVRELVLEAVDKEKKHFTLETLTKMARQLLSERVEWVSNGIRGWTSQPNLELRKLAGVVISDTIKQNEDSINELIENQIRLIAEEKFDATLNKLIDNRVRAKLKSIIGGDE